jgi:hypothetical protein
MIGYPLIDKFQQSNETFNLRIYLIEKQSSL